MIFILLILGGITTSGFAEEVLLENPCIKLKSPKNCHDKAAEILLARKAEDYVYYIEKNKPEIGEPPEFSAGRSCGKIKDFRNHAAYSVFEKTLSVRYDKVIALIKSGEKIPLLHEDAFSEAAADYNKNVNRGSLVADKGGITTQRSPANTFESECKGSDTKTEDHRQFRCQWNSANLNWLAQFTQLVALDTLVEAEKNQISFGDELSKEGKKSGQKCVRKVASDCLKFKCGNPFNRFNSCLRGQCKDRFDDVLKTRDRIVGANLGMLSFLLIFLTLLPAGCAQKGDMGGSGPNYPPTSKVPDELPKLKDYSDNTDRSLSAAESLVSEKKELAPEQKYHQMAAVAAKGGGDLGTDYNAPEGSKQDELGAPDLGAKSGPGGGDSGTPATGGGGPSGLSVVSTKDKVSPNLDPRLAEDPGAAGAGYSKGGGSGGAEGGIKGAFASLTGLFGAGGGSGGASGAASGVSEQDYEGREIAAVGSADPENYMSLIDPSQNIFKVVEKKYKQKEMDWSLYRAGAQAK